MKLQHSLLTRKPNVVYVYHWAQLSNTIQLIYLDRPKFLYQSKKERANVVKGVWRIKYKS